MSHGTTEPSSNQQLQNEIYSKSYYVCVHGLLYPFSNIKCRRNKKTSWDVNTTNATASCKPTAAKEYTRAVSVMTMLKDTTLWGKFVYMFVYYFLITSIGRHETKNMLCMLCLHLQPAAQHCRQCHQQMARYYCDKCKLWDNDPRKAIYHCDDCGICRQGKQEDFFHCKKCNICMVKSMTDHKCIERNLECDCPICGEYMFTSTTTVIFMVIQENDNIYKH